MHLLLLLSLCLVRCNEAHQDEDWIDPTDMFYYDAASGRMKNRPQNNNEDVPVKEPAEDAQVAQDTECKIIVENLKLEVEKCKNAENPSPSTSDPVFRRYLHKVLNGVARLGLPDNSQPQVHYDAEVVLTSEMLAEINKFLNDADWSLGALDEALSRTLVDFKHHKVEEWKWNFEDHFGIDIYTTFMICLCLLVIVVIIATELWTRIGWFAQLKRLCIMSFVVSIAWNWMYLYKVAFAERQAEMAKMDKFDGSCGEKISWSESLFEWIKTSSSFQNDPCEEYFKSLMIHPILLVPPTKALALTFTDFITEPLKHVGKGIGEFLRNVLVEIPLFYQLPVLLIIALALLVFCYGTSTSIGQISWQRNNRDANSERLTLRETQRPTDGRFIEGSNRQPHYEQLQYQPNASNQRPEILRAMDCADDPNPKKPQFILADLTITLKENSVGKQENKYDTRQEQDFERLQVIKETAEGKPLEIKDTAEQQQQQMKYETIKAESSNSQDDKEEHLINTTFMDKTHVPNGHEEKHVPAPHTDNITCCN